MSSVVYVERMYTRSKNRKIKMAMDTFVFSVKNLSAAMFDVISGNALTIGGGFAWSLVEGGIINLEELKLEFCLSITNTGETSGTVTAELYEGLTLLETQTAVIAGLATGEVTVNNAGVGYDNLDGTTRDFHVDVN